MGFPIRSLAAAFVVATAVVAAAGAARAATIVVSTTADSVNGCVSSPDCLNGNPGPDGISMREAMLAANAVPGPHTITFAPSLVGATIAPGSDYPSVTQNGITITGLTDGTGQPTVTFDAAGTHVLFGVRASGFTFTSMKIVNLLAPFPGGHWGVQVLAGQVASLGSQRISDLVIRKNVFSNSSSAPSGIPLSIGTLAAASGALVTNVTIADNTFLHIRGETTSIRINTDGTGNTIEDVAVTGNSLTDTTFGVELVPTGTNTRILRTRIAGNTFESSLQPINFNPINNEDGSVNGALIDDTLIARNVFRNNRGPAMAIVAGIVDTSSPGSASNNVISNVRILNNLVTGSTQYGAVSLAGGRMGATNNTLTNVTVMNNTFVGNPGQSSALVIDENLDGSTGNVISNVKIANTIFWDNAPSDVYNVTPAQVSNSVIAQAGFATVNGNIGADPKFAGAGDFHLQATSPAIGAGLHANAPFGDLDCKVRPNPPAIGAYEPGSGGSCIDTMPVASLLPVSRSVQVGNLATAFAAMINTGSATAKACGLAPAANVPGTFTFRTTNPATNQVTGSDETPVDIPAGRLQTYVFGFRPNEAYGPADTALQFACANTYDSAVVAGLDTLLFSASTGPVPDIVALAASTDPGYVDLPGANGLGAFSVASVNVGSAATITVSGDTGAASLPVAITLCQTNAQAQCTNPPSPAPTATVSIAANATPTFSIFVMGSGAVANNPTSNRVFVRFKDGGGVTRGSTSVAVRTQ